MFVVDNGVLYIVGNGFKRLVVPADCRPLVMHLAQTHSLGPGILVGIKHFLRISTRFYWAFNV